MNTILRSVLVSSAMLFLMTSPALAQTTPAPATVSPSAVAEAAIAEAQLPNPLGNITDVRLLIGRVIQAILGLSGALALIMFIYGGILWMISQGDPEKIKKGQNTILWSVLGLAILFGAYALVNLVIQSLTQSTT